MPRSFNGTGTAYYGKALKRNDGSYVVTEWVTFLWLPVLPLGSKRVWYQDHENRWQGTSTRFKVAPVPVYWPQVAWGYAITVGLFGGGWLLSAENQHWIEDNVGWVLPMAALVLVSVAMLLIIRRRSRSPDETGQGNRDWTMRKRSALMLSSTIGAAIGVAVAFVLTGDGSTFVVWLLNQSYYEWAAVGWGIAGLILAPSLLLLIKIAR